MTPGHVWTIDICKTSFHYYIDKVKSFRNSNFYKSLNIHNQEPYILKSNSHFLDLAYDV